MKMPHTVNVLNVLRDERLSGSSPNVAASIDAIANLLDAASRAARDVEIILEEETLTETARRRLDRLIDRTRLAIVAATTP
jgi:hypothetical protein